MGKRNYNTNQEKIDRYIKEGRGQGEKKNYKPWITVQDFPSMGRVSRCFSWKTGRMHEFMSDHEARYFYLMLWSDKVIDIREQYPILDVEATIKISEEKNIKHPEDSKSKTPIVLTTDFMLTVLKDGKEFNVARTVKPSKDLEKKRVIEKFEIERAYYEAKGIDWAIVTEKEIPNIFALNIEWAYSAHKLEATNEASVEALQHYSLLLKNNLFKYSNEKLQELLIAMDKDMNLENGTFLYLLKHLISTKQIKIIDMNQKINIASVVRAIIDIN
jgi:hypothetical protein